MISNKYALLLHFVKNVEKFLAIFLIKRKIFTRF